VCWPIRDFLSSDISRNSAKFGEISKRAESVFSDSKEVEKLRDGKFDSRAGQNAPL